MSGAGETAWGRRAGARHFEAGGGGNSGPRWNAERWLAGWRLRLPGAGKIQKKLSPYLFPYDGLPVNIKDYDRQTARDFPLILDLLGKTLIRPGERKRIVGRQKPALVDETR